jgi:hypothetical protein
MSFSEQLTVSGLTAREVAEAVSPLLSVRTVEDWLQARRTPPEWSHAFILSRIRRRSNATGKRDAEI